MSDVTEELQRFDMSDGDRREDGLAAASLAVRRGELVVLPTDTVYGLGCDAFEPESVQALLDAKGRGRDMPPPVLISAVTTLDALASSIPEWARVLADSYWPGPLTLVCPQQESLQWDLGETKGTVAVRMPDHDVALDLIQRTGPLAVSSANSTGEPAATDADGAERMLGASVRVLLDSGATPGEKPSTIVDCTGERPRILREGALDLADLSSTLVRAGTVLEDTDGQVVEAPDRAPEVAPEPTTTPWEEPVAADEPAGGTTTEPVVAPTTRTTSPTTAPAKKAPAKKTAKKTAAKKAPAKKATAEKAPARQTPAKKAPAKKAPAKKAPAKNAAAEKAPTEKASTETATAKEAPASSTAAKRAPTTRTSAKKTATQDEAGGAGTSA